jgi:hypothetical protein
MIEKVRQTGETILSDEHKLDDRPKQPYQSPRLVKFGDLRTITLAPTPGETDESGFEEPRDWL